MYYDCSEEEIRTLCRNSIESLEIWARRLIDEKMTEKYGKNYIDFCLENGTPIIKKEVCNRVKQMQQKEPKRFPRVVDALLLDDIIYILCKPEFYKNLFQDAMKYSYPHGHDEARDFLTRLIPIRNSLSHSNHISMHQAEQAVCYSNDFIESIKIYEKERGKEKVWNIPRIIRITDSLGNTFENPIDKNINSSIFIIEQKLYCGETYSIDVEIDSSFSENEYDIVWKDYTTEIFEFHNKTHFIMKLSEKDVSESHGLSCLIISHEKWHKYKFYDCKVDLLLTILPPVL